MNFKIDSNQAMVASSGLVAAEVLTRAKHGGSMAAKHGGQRKEADII